MEKEIIEVEKNEILPVNSGDEMMSQPDRLLEMAISKGADMAQLEKLLDLKERYDNELARKAFTAALAEFKKKPPVIVKDLLNKQYNSSYVSIGGMVNPIAECLAKNGFSHRWEYEPIDKNGIKVTCVLTHSLGHSESVAIPGYPDESGKKNALQQMKSTRTYLKLETFEAVTGMVSVNCNLNDDGAGAGKPVELITEEQALALHARITDNDLILDIFLKWAKVESIEDIKAANFGRMNKGIDDSIKSKEKANEST